MDRWCQYREFPDSEEVLGDWLRQIGATELCHMGGKSSPGPPDWVINYKDHTIAVEVTLLPDKQNRWPHKKEIGVERRLCRLVEKVSREHDSPLRWLVQCEYDPKQPPSAMGRGKWEDRALKTLREAAREAPTSLQDRPLLPQGKARRWGVSLSVFARPAKENSGHVQVSSGVGSLVSQTLIERATSAIEEKAKKVRGSIARGERAQCYYKWWLVFNDEVLFVPAIAVHEWKIVDDAIHACSGISAWSKVVLVNRFQPRHTAQPMNKWHRAFFEDPADPPLPHSPAWGPQAQNSDP